MQIYIGNLPYDFTEEELREIWSVSQREKTLFRSSIRVR